MQLPNLSPWGIDAATATATRPPRGTNNDVRLIDTPLGPFVWRCYDNLSCSRVVAEHALLAWLADHDLPFEVPVPIPTTAGDTFDVLPDGRAAAIHRFLPGTRADDSAAEMELVATAFARLCALLADAPTELAPIDWTNTRLAAIHDGIGDPAELLAEFRKSSADAGWLIDTLDSEDDMLAALLALPRQIVHGDVAASNALVSGGHITGLIDFEIAILPEVVRQRLAGSVLWRAGRWRNGDAGFDEVIAHLREGEQGVRRLVAYR